MRGSAEPTQKRFVLINPSDTPHSKLDEVDAVSVPPLISIVYHLFLFLDQLRLIEILELFKSVGL